MTLPERVDFIGKNMVAILIKGLRSGTIALDRAQQIAEFYLDKLSTAKSTDELKQDLVEMESSIPEMKTIVEYEKAQVKEASEQELRQKIEVLLKEGKIEEAAELAKQK